MLGKLNWLKVYECLLFLERSSTSVLATLLKQPEFKEYRKTSRETIAGRFGYFLKLLPKKVIPTNCSTSSTKLIFKCLLLSHRCHIFKISYFKSILKLIKNLCMFITFRTLE